MKRREHLNFFHKLCFYDTGLACALLGIQNGQQLNYHHLAGSLFENLIINELIKTRYNKAKNKDLYFWRDNVGHELDIIIESPDGLYPVEIKYGKTISTEFFKGLLFWQKISNKQNGAVIYGGDTIQKRSNGIEVIPWSKSGEL